MASCAETPAQKTECSLQGKPDSVMFVRVPLSEQMYNRIEALPTLDPKDMELRMAVTFDNYSKKAIFRFDAWSWPAKVVKIPPRLFYDGDLSAFVPVDLVIVCRHVDDATLPDNEEEDMRLATVQMPFVNTLGYEATVYHEIFISTTCKREGPKFEDAYKRLLATARNPNY